MCEHESIETENYLNPCSMADCRLNSPVTYHLNCDSQVRDVCTSCSAILYDSADEPVEMVEIVYMCRLCKTEGVQPGHFACGDRFWVPEYSAAGQRRELAARSAVKETR